MWALGGFSTDPGTKQANTLGDGSYLHMMKSKNDWIAELWTGAQFYELGDVSEEGEVLI